MTIVSVLRFRFFAKSNICVRTEPTVRIWAHPTWEVLVYNQKTRLFGGFFYISKESYLTAAAVSTMAWKAGKSLTTKSANILRSTWISAFFS